MHMKKLTMLHPTTSCIEILEQVLPDQVNGSQHWPMCNIQTQEDIPSSGQQVENLT
jgi:hypothetical protein